MEFAEEFARFRERVGKRRVPALIVPGSGQATTAALLVGALQPGRVAFLLTPESAGMPAAVARLLGLWREGWSPEDEGWGVLAEDHTDPLQIYRSLRAIIDAWADLPRESIAVDLTGGTKPMSVGLGKAAYVLKIEALYIESDFTPPDAAGRRQLIPGTQRLAPPPDPYVVFGDLEAAEAARLFAAHDYAGAERIFAELARRLAGAADDAERAGAAELAARIQPMAADFALRARLARAYAAWDSFDLKTAGRELEAYRAAAGLVGARDVTLAEQISDLGRLQEVTGSAAGRGEAALATLADPDAVLPLLGSLYANASRRAAQGRYDSAALLCYRCLELCSQHRLATWGVLTEQPDLGQALARAPDLEHRYEAVQRRQFPGKRPYRLPDRSFGLFVGYMLLEALADPLVAGYPIERVQRGTKLRNTSIFAHGYRLIRRPEYEQFAAIADDMLTRLFAVLGRDRAPWSTRSTFLSLE